MLDPYVKVKVKGQVDLLGHKVGHGNPLWPVTYLGYKLGQIDHKGHSDLWGHEVGHGDN